MDKIKKGLIGSILISMILAVTLGYVLATTSTTTFYITTGLYPGAPHYTIWTEGTGATQAYYAKRYDGFFPTFSGSTNASYVINSVISSLTYGGKVYFLHPGAAYAFFLDSPILINKTFIELEGEDIGTWIRLKDGTDKDLIQVGYGAADVIITSLTLDGNNLHNTVGNVIEANTTNLKVINCRIQNGSDNNIAFYQHGTDFCGGHWILDSMIWGATECGIYGSGISHNFIMDNEVRENAQGNIMLYGVANSTVSSNQIFGASLGHADGLTLQNCVSVSVQNNRIDHNVGHGIEIINSNSTIINGNRIFLNSRDASNTYSGLHIVDYLSSPPGNLLTIDLQIINNLFKTSATETQKRAITADMETADAVHWLIMGNNVNGNLSSPAIYFSHSYTSSIIEHNEGFP